MDDFQKATALTCMKGAEQNTMKFPEIVAALASVGFERYAVDFCRADHTYYVGDGASIVLPMVSGHGPVAEKFDVAALQAAIREAQHDVPGYTYEGFCRNAVNAGCVGYVVSFSGKRAVYSGRSAEIHVEHFPD